MKVYTISSKSHSYLLASQLLSKQQFLKGVRDFAHKCTIVVLCALGIGFWKKPMRADVLGQLISMCMLGGVKS